MPSPATKLVCEVATKIAEPLAIERRVVGVHIFRSGTTIFLLTFSYSIDRQLSQIWLMLVRYA